MILLHRNSSCCYLSVQNDVQTEITLDVAEPFGLDPDFDYDNVQLSAKFTVEQWRGDAVRGPGSAVRSGPQCPLQWRSPEGL